MLGRVCLVVVMAMGVCASAHAKPEFWNFFREHYQLKDHFPNFKSGCLNCHTAVPERNAYGRQVQAGVRAAGPELTAAVLAPLEQDDSDGDGWPNGQEIKEGWLPGDPASHPEGTPPMAVKPVAPPEATGALTVEIPDHRFHPLVVHFPIALFLFGAFLDVLGFRRGDEGLRRLALWNLGVGAVSSILAVALGVLALLALQWELQGTMLAHFGFGLAASASMLMTFMVRRQGEPPTKPGYWVLLGVACIATAVTGHLGSVLVFGG